MLSSLNRRQFIRAGGAAMAGLSFGHDPLAQPGVVGAAEPARTFQISLAEWSLHRTLRGKKMDHLDFPRVAKVDYGIDAVEYVNQFFKDKAKDDQYLGELKKRCGDHGVRSLLIMCDGEGALGDADPARRQKAVDNHHRWVDAALFLGCHSIRVNAQSSGSYDEQLERAAEGLARLSEYGGKHKINVIVENHGGLSSNGAWLAAVMKKVNSPWCGTLPDFGNFGAYDRYKGVTELMPFAKGVSAKSHDFDPDGNETRTDYLKMMKIVLDAGYHGYVGIEYEGSKLSEPDGIRATKKLLERVREQLSK
jgi:sugar phosphate isomerase/epimerase